MEPSLPFFIAPLVDALESFEGWSKREGNVRVIAATKSWSELRQKELPSHIQIRKRPLKGRRVPIRGARRSHRTRLKIAHYPEDHMNEIAVSTLLLIVKGHAKIYAGNYILMCQPGDIVLIPSGVPKADFLSHAIDNDPSTVSKILYIYPGQLLGSGLECWIAHSSGEQIEGNAVLGAALLKSRFLSMLFDQTCVEIKRSPRSEITYLMVRNLILFLQRELRECRALMPHVKRLQQPMDHTYNPIKHALEYVQSHLDSNLTIDLMARETAISATSFKQMFRHETGQTFHEYLTKLRLEFAKTLLHNTDLKLSDVARHAGLSQSQLNRLFRYSPGVHPRRISAQKINV